MHNRVWFLLVSIFFLLNFSFGLKFEIVSENHSIIDNEIVLRVLSENEEKSEKLFKIMSNEVFDVKFDKKEFGDNDNRNKKEENDEPNKKEKISFDTPEVKLVDKNKTILFKQLKFDLPQNDEQLIKINFKTKPIFINNKFVNSGNWEINPNSWWNTAWSHVVLAKVFSSGTANGHNFLIKFDENNMPWVNYVRKSDCSDFRITNFETTAELKHYVAYCDPNKTWIWVKSDLNYGENKFWVYFGNQNAVSASDFNNTFYKVDDFEDGTLTNPNWNGTLSHFSATNKRLDIVSLGVYNIYLNINQVFSGINYLYPKNSGFFVAVNKSNIQQTEFNVAPNLSGESGFAIQEGFNYRCYFCDNSVVYTSYSKSGLNFMFMTVDKNSNFLVRRESDFNFFTYNKINGNPALQYIGVYKNGYTGPLLDNIFISKTYLDLNVFLEENYSAFFTDYTTLDNVKFYNKKVYYKFVNNCVNKNIRIDLNEGNILLAQHNFLCDSFVDLNFVYNYSTDGNKTLTLTTYVNDINSNQIIDSFLLDSTAPSIDYAVLAFTNKANIKFKCNDELSPKLRHIIKINNTIVLNDINNKNTNYDINYDLIDGLNVFNVYCEDGAGNKSETKTSELTSFKKRFYFVYNKTGVALTGKPNYVSADINSLFVFNSDNNSYQDMYNPGNVSYQYQTTNKNTNIYFLLTYNASGLPGIRNDFDIDVIPDGNIPICFENLQSFNEQRFVSSTKRKVILQNITSKCYYFGTRTKYAIGDYYYANAYITPASYNLWIEDDKGIMQKVSLVIGDQAQQINIDTLLLKTREYQVVINNEFLSVRSACINNDCNALIVKYYNARQDNNSLSISVYKDLTQLYYFEMSDANVNEATLLINTSDWNVGYETFEIRASSKKNDGTTNLIKFYYNFRFRKTTQLDPILVLFGSFAVVFIGLTIVSAKSMFGWFGVVILLIGLFITTFTKQEWYIILFQAILLIILLFIMLIYKGKDEYV